MHPGFSQMIGRFLQLKEDDLLALWNLFELKDIQKKEHFLVEGRINKELGFLAEGFMRGYYMQDGTEVTSHFYFAPTLVADLTSDRMKVNGRLNVQALEDAKMYITDFEKVEKLALERPPIMLLFLRFVEHLYIFASNRQLSFLFDSPVDRYKNLFKERPKVVANIPLQYIASYLGINPETLSRIRKKLSQEGQ